MTPETPAPYERPSIAAASQADNRNAASAIAAVTTSIPTQTTVTTAMPIRTTALISGPAGPAC